MIVELLIAPLLLALLPTIFRELAVHAVWSYAYYVKPALPPRAVSEFPADVMSISFAGNGGDSRQAQRATGAFPNSAVVVRNMIKDVPEPADIWKLGALRVYNPLDVNLAQQHDCEHATRLLLKAFQDYPDKRFVVHGTSRGAALALEVVALLSEDVVKKRVALLMCEAPFTTVEEVIDARYNPYIGWAARLMLRVVTAYRAKYNVIWSPKAMASNFPHKTLPIVVISSNKDVVVPARLQHSLVQLLREGGAKEVHEIKLMECGHSSFTWDNDADRITYVSEMEKIYAKFLNQEGGGRVKKTV